NVGAEALTLGRLIPHYRTRTKNRSGYWPSRVYVTSQHPVDGNAGPPAAKPMSPYASTPIARRPVVPEPSNRVASYSTWPRFVRYGGILSSSRPTISPLDGRIT